MPTPMITQRLTYILLLLPWLNTPFRAQVYWDDRHLSQHIPDFFFEWYVVGVSILLQS